MATIRSANFRRPGGGLANAERAHLLGQDEFAVLQNMKVRSGNLVKRGGTVQQGDAPDAAVVRWTMNAYDTVGGSNVNRLRFCNGKIQYLTGGAWTNLATGLTATTYPRAVAYQDKVWMCDGTMTPRKITIGGPPTIANWTTMPASFNPSLVTLHKNRIYIAGDSALPTYVYMSAPGDPTTFAATDFYQVPDNQQGFAPQEMKSFGEWIGFFCEDYACSLTGTGPLSHRIFQYPKGAALVCPRTVVDMGGYAIYHTDKGCAVWDGYGKPELLDPYGRINWGDFNLTTVNETWAMRWSDREYAIFFRSKGATSAAATGTPFARSSMVYALRSRLTVATTADAQTAHYLLYDTVTKQWSGPHTGNWLSGDMESYRYGDRQNPWLGSSTTNGVTALGEQPTFSDLTLEYPCLVRTGSLFDAFTRVKLDRLKILTGWQLSASAKYSVGLNWEGNIALPYDAQWDVRNEPDGQQGTDSSKYVTETYRGDFVIARLSASYKENERYSGYQPVIEITENSTEAFELRGYEAVFSPTSDEEAKE